MKCKNCFCIFQKNGNCLLDSVEININGVCTSFTAVNVSEEELNKLKPVPQCDYTT
jgi:hypothetical protein